MHNYILFPEEEIVMIKIIFYRTYILTSIVLFISSFITAYVPYALNLDVILFSGVSTIIEPLYSGFSHIFVTGFIPDYAFMKVIKDISENYDVLSAMYVKFYVGKIYCKVIETITPILIMLHATVLLIILANFNPGEVLQIITLIGRREFFKNMIFSVIITNFLLASSIGIPYTTFTKGFSLMDIVMSILSFFNLLLLISLISLITFIIIGSSITSLVVGLIMFIITTINPGIIPYISPLINLLKPNNTYAISDFLLHMAIYVLWVTALLIISYKSFMKRELY